VNPGDRPRLACFDIPTVASLDPWALVLFAAAAVAVFKVSTAATLIASFAAGVTLFVLGLMG